MMNDHHQAALLLLTAHNPHLADNDITSLLDGIDSSFAQSFTHGTEGMTVDLHHLFVQEARTVLSNALTLARLRGLRTLTLITGVGRHSGQRGPVLQPLVREQLRHSQLLFTTGAGGGSFRISFT
jgi:DNA-nicking Smr family endonuclease